jgi:hypothetical protein
MIIHIPRNDIQSIGSYMRNHELSCSLIPTLVYNKEIWGLGFPRATYWIEVERL